MMKTLSIYHLFLLVIIYSCKTSHKEAAPDTINYQRKNTCLDSDLESLKWFFYAYTYECDVLFKTGKESVVYKAVECDITIDCQQVARDSLFVRCLFNKDSLHGVKIYNCLSVEKAMYSRSGFRPLTGHVVIEEFSDSSQVQEDNFLTVKRFESFLRNTDTSILSGWLRSEIRERRIF